MTSPGDTEIVGSRRWCLMDQAYRLTISGRAGATSYCFLALSQEEAIVQASLVIALVGEGASSIALTCNGCDVASFNSVPANAAGPARARPIKSE